MFAAMLVLTLMLGVTDWLSGYELQFFIFYFLPIGITLAHEVRDFGIDVNAVSAAAGAKPDVTVEEIVRRALAR